MNVSFPRRFVFPAFIVLALWHSPLRAQQKLSEAIPTGDTDAGLFLSVGPGLAIFNGNTGWSVDIGALSPSTLPWIFVGADLGLNFWSFRTAAAATTVSTSATGFQLSPTAIVRFDIDQAPGIHPYVGASIGPYLYIESITTTLAGVQTTASNTTLYIQTLFRPGIFTNFTDTVALNVEPALGLLGTRFIFVPSVSAYFRI